MSLDDNKLELDFSKIKEKDKYSKYKNSEYKQSNNDKNINKQKQKINSLKIKKRLAISRRIQLRNFILRMIISILITTAYYVFVYYFKHKYMDMKVFLHSSIGFIIYLFLAYLVRPEPDMNNLGYFHGLINKPFDHTDDYNRFLLNLKIFFIPGVIISETIVELFDRIRGN